MQTMDGIAFELQTLRLVFAQVESESRATLIRQMKIPARGCNERGRQLRRPYGSAGTSHAPQWKFGP